MNQSKRNNQQSKERDSRIKKAQEDAIDKTLEDTFPASDPPAWYGAEHKKK